MAKRMPGRLLAFSGSAVATTCIAGLLSTPNDRRNVAAALAGADDPGGRDSNLWLVLVGVALSAVAPCAASSIRGRTRNSSRSVSSAPT
jgi:hypothetical protein